MKKLYILFLVVGGIIIAAYLFMRFSLQRDIRKEREKQGMGNKAFAAPAKNPDSTLDLRPLFKTRLQQLVKDGSRGLYDLSIDSMTVDVLKSTVTLMNVRLSPDRNALAALDRLKQAPDDVFEISLRSLKLNGINIDDAFNDKTMVFSSLAISAPIIEVYHQKRAYNRKKSINPSNLYQRIKKHINKIALSNLTVESGTVISYDVKNKNKKTKFNDVLLRFHDILIDSSTQQATDRFLFAKKALMSMRNYAVNTTDNLYQFKVDVLTIEAPKQLLTLDNISLSSKYNRQQFKKGLLQQKEQYDLKVPKVLVHEVDWWSLMNNERFVADKIVINNPKLKVHLDRSLPPKNKMGAFPHQLLMKLPMEVYVKKLQVRNLDLAYEEYNPRSAQSGTLYFDKANLDIANITNMPQYIKQKKHTTINASANFMRQVPFRAYFMLDLANSKQGGFSADLKMEGFDGSLINSFTVPLGLFKIEDGKVERVKANVQGGQHKAKGKVLLLYNDLKLSLYEKEQDEKGLDKRGLIGLIANNFVIKDENPKKNEDPREASTEFQRDPYGGFLNLVWKTSLTGILETIGANPKLANKK